MLQTAKGRGSTVVSKYESVSLGDLAGLRILVDPPVKIIARLVGFFGSLDDLRLEELSSSTLAQFKRGGDKLAEDLLSLELSVTEGASFFSERNASLMRACALTGDAQKVADEIFWNAESGVFEKK